MQLPSNLRRVGTTRATLGEGVRHDALGDLLTWVDIPESRAWCRGSDGQDIETSSGPHAAFSCLTGDGSLLAGCDGGFFLDGHPLGRDFLPPETVLNDGAVHPSGAALVFGSRDRAEERPTGRMWYLGRELVQLPWSFTVFNGPAFNPQGDRVYFADSPARVIYSAHFDPESSTVGEREVFAVVPETLGYPDGMTCDDAGGLWSTHWDGACITRYNADGTVDTRFRMPVARPTSIVFRGRTAFVTSAQLDDADSNEGNDGGLFAFETELSGPSSPRLNRSVLKPVT